MKYILLILLFAFAQNANASIPEFPMSFWGDVLIDGQLAPVGTIVRAYNQSNDLVGEIVVSELGVYGYTEPVKQKLVVGKYEGLITFKFQSPQINSGIETSGLNSLTYPVFESGLTIEKDLMFVTKTASVSGGGGGGGSKTIKKLVDTATTTVAGMVSTTTILLPEYEQKILLQKQIIELLTKLIELLKLRVL
jgi:hypothetical protein